MQLLPYLAGLLVIPLCLLELFIYVQFLLILLCSIVKEAYKLIAVVLLQAVEPPFLLIPEFNEFVDKCLLLLEEFLSLLVHRMI